MVSLHIMRKILLHNMVLFYELLDNTSIGSNHQVSHSLCEKKYLRVYLTGTNFISHRNKLYIPQIRFQVSLFPVYQPCCNGKIVFTYLELLYTLYIRFEERIGIIVFFTYVKHVYIIRTMFKAHNFVKIVAIKRLPNTWPIPF